MDQLDQAQLFEEIERAAVLEAQAARAAIPEGDWRMLSAMWCEVAGCGERIPDERRRAIPGVRFCVQCQAMTEQREGCKR
mgnify:FL=1